MYELFMEKCVGFTDVLFNNKYLSNPPQLEDSAPHICWSALRHITNWILWVLATTHVVLKCYHNQVLTTGPLFDSGTEAKLFFSAREKKKKKQSKIVIAT